SLSKAEDVVHEEQNVLSSFVAEVLSTGQSRQCHTSAGSRGLVHLTKDQCCLAQYRLTALKLRLRHLKHQVIAFASSFTHAGKNRNTTMCFRHVVDEFLDENRLAYAGTTEKTDFSAFTIGSEQVDDLNSRLKYFDLRTLINELR